MNLVVQNVAILFTFVFLGFFVGKLGIIDHSSTPDLCNFLLKVTLPATVFCSMLRPFELTMLHDSALILGLMIGYHLLCMLIGALAVRAGHISGPKAGVWVFVCMFCNNGFMGLPLGQSLYGNYGLFLMAVANVISNLLIFSVGALLLTHGKNGIRLSGRQLLYNNINIAVALGAVFYFTQWQVPAFPLTILQQLGGLTGPLSMIVVGLSASRYEVKKMFQDRSIYVLTAIRLLLITAGIVHLLPFRTGSIIPALLILTAALPAPSSSTIILEQHHMDTETAAQAIFLSTLFSLVTVPLMMSLL